jgi:hypothetical protein
VGAARERILGQSDPERLERWLAALIVLLVGVQAVLPNDLVVLVLGGEVLRARVMGERESRSVWRGSSRGAGIDALPVMASRDALPGSAAIP